MDPVAPLAGREAVRTPGRPAGVGQGDGGSPHPPPRGELPPAVSSALDVSLVFEVNSESGELLVKVVDRRSDRVLRQVPPEEVQRLRGVLRALRGLLVDRRG